MENKSIYVATKNTFFWRNGLRIWMTSITKQDFLHVHVHVMFLKRNWHVTYTTLRQRQHFLTSRTNDPVVVKGVLSKATSNYKSMTQGGWNTIPFLAITSRRDFEIILFQIPVWKSWNPRRRGWVIFYFIRPGTLIGMVLSTMHRSDMPVHSSIARSR